MKTIRRYLSPCLPDFMTMHFHSNWMLARMRFTIHWIPVTRIRVPCEYTGPILIKDASENENVYCLIEDVSPYNDVEMLERNGYKRLHEYSIPQKPVDKVNVVKAVSVDDKGNYSRVMEAVYFVGFKDKKGYDGINIMTITTDPEHLFSRETGIYVMGKTFEDNVVDGIVQYEVNNANALKTNYRQKGRRGRRRATIHCFNPNGNMIFSGISRYPDSGQYDGGQIAKEHEFICPSGIWPDCF